MDIFISWHGKRSHAAAEALRGWLPLIVNAFKPWRGGFVWREIF